MRACEEEEDGESVCVCEGRGVLAAISECEVDPVTGFIGCIETKIRTLCYCGIFLPPPKAGDFNSPRKARRALLF